MRSIISIRIVAVLLIGTMLSQSCRVYHRESVTLDEAISEGKRVKIRTVHNETYIYKAIEKVDGVYYGIKMKRKKPVKTPIKTDEIKKVKLHNKTMSIVYGSVIGAVVTFVVVGFVALATWDLDVIGGSIQAPN